MSESPSTRPPLMSLDDAIAHVLAAVADRPIAETQSVSTFDARGRVLAADLRAGIDVPPLDNAEMDGYALRVADVPAARTSLRVVQRIAAGGIGRELHPGEAARIFTGAPVPPGADAVVMQELCTADGEHVRIDTVPRLGQSIRRRGADVQSGSCVLAAGVRLTPQALGLAASIGAGSLTVARRPNVAIFSTGDELAMPGEPLKPGGIYNSNRYTLRALVDALGGVCNDLGIVPDNLDATRDALRRAAAHNDLIVTSGGVSVGEEDHLKPAVRAEGRLDMWQIAVKPGKPLAFGEVFRPDGTAAWFVGLPGNPVASFIMFLLVVRPLLLRMQGATDLAPRPTLQRADFDWPRADKRREFLRVRRNGHGGLDLFGNQSSGVMTSTVWADGVIDNPEGRAIKPGDTVAYIPFADWLS